MQVLYAVLGGIRGLRQFVSDRTQAGHAFAGAAHGAIDLFHEDIERSAQIGDFVLSLNSKSRGQVAVAFRHLVELAVHQSKSA